jgi:hypothetical protein
MAATELQQMIDVVAKDKGIDPAIVIGAIEDAYLAASRKVFRGDEDLRTRFNLETGQVELYAVRSIVADVTNPAREISLGEAQELYGEEAEVGMEIEFPKETEKLGRIAAQTAKQVIAQRVREAEREKIHGEFGERIGEVVTATGQTVRERRHHRGNRPRRVPDPAQGAVARGKLRDRRSRAGRHQGRQSQRQGPAGRPLADRSRVARETLRTGSPGNLRRHRHDSRRGTRGR